MNLASIPISQINDYVIIQVKKVKKHTRMPEAIELLPKSTRKSATSKASTSRLNYTAYTVADANLETTTDIYPMASSFHCIGGRERPPDSPRHALDLSW